jgi:hypothetical protein
MPEITSAPTLALAGCGRFRRAAPARALLYGIATPKAAWTSPPGISGKSSPAMPPVLAGPMPRRPAASEPVTTLQAGRSAQGG